MERSRRHRKERESMDRPWLEKRALRYAARWETSAAGVALHLEQKIRRRCEETGETPSETLGLIADVIGELVERGYVDDARFAETTIDRLRRQGRSSTQIEARLRSKGVAESVYGRLLGNERAQDDLRAAWRLARRRQIGPYCHDVAQREADRDRHLAVLARQGFNLEMAERVIDADTPPQEHQ